MNRWKCLLAALMLGLGAASAAAEHRLHVPWPTDLGPLNPHLYSPNQMFAQAMVYEPLVRYQAGGEIVPWLAERWSLSEDGREYTFTLRDGVRFSNGEPFDAAAVAANFRAALVNHDGHAWLESASQIAAVDALDEKTVRIRLREPYYPLLQELALPRPFRFVAPSQFQDGGTIRGIAEPIGTGPWRLAESRLGEHYRFERNAHYWGDAPAYDSVMVKVMSDPNSRAIALETGEVDLVYGISGPISPDTFERFQKRGVMTAALSEPYETLMLAMNSAQGPTRDPAVRRAVNHAVDKDLMIDTVLYGTQKRADTLFAPNVPYADIGLQPYAYDPQRAIRLLEDAGWKLEPGRSVRRNAGQDLEIELVFVGTDALHKSMAEIIQADLAKVGIGATLVGEEESSVYARQRNGRFGMVFNRTWGAPYDPHAFVSSMRAPSHADFQAQQGLPDKPAIDARIDSVLLSTDDAEREALYADILTRLHEHAVYLPLTYLSAIAVARPGVEDVGFGAMSSEIPFERFRPKVD